MDSSSIKKLVDYLKSISLIKENDTEETENKLVSKFMSSIMLYNYYNKRSGLSADMSNDNSYYDKVYSFMNVLNK